MMTIQEAIKDVIEKRPNQFTQQNLVRWLSELELDMVEEVFSRYQGFEKEKAFTGYDENTPLSTTLLIKAPYDSLYCYWLYAMVDFHHNEMNRYNAAALMYAQRLAAFKNHINRNHMPNDKNRIKHLWVNSGRKKTSANPLG